MKSVIIEASQLGVNCWRPVRFLNSCHLCPNYKHCKYPERVANKEYDETETEMLIAFREYKRLSCKLQNI